MDLSSFPSWPGKFYPIFEKHFHAEIESIRETLKSGEYDDDEQRKSLRLALLTAGHLEGADLRHDMLKRGIVDCLSKGTALTSDQIAQIFSADLGLPYTIRTDVFGGALAELQKQGLVLSTAAGWQLTPSGNEFALELPLEAANSILRGRAVIRDSVERLIGKKLSDDQNNRIWSTLLDFLSALFYQKGLDVIHAFETFLSEAPNESSDTSLQSILRDGAH